MSSSEFWKSHSVLNVLAELNRIMGRNVIRHSAQGEFKNHHIIEIDYLVGFNLAEAEPELRRYLDSIEWQIVTTGRSYRYPDQENVPSFGIAPILRKKVTTAYHATRTCVIPMILNEGLLPSNIARKATTFPDTGGVIHVCERLRCNPGENDSAEWWRDHSSQNNRVGDSSWSILRINLAGVPTARIYQDMHSQSGVVVDRIERIPPGLITSIEGSATSPDTAS